MKRILLVFTLLLSFAAAHAAPVGMEEARSLGQRYVNTCFNAPSELSLVYSQPSFYVFNVGNTGFVILSSDDCYRPLIGYSEEGPFHPDDMAPALQDYLDGVTASRSNRTAVQDPNVAREWQTFRENGHVNEPYRGKADTFLVETRWNQNYPYNYHCPEAEDGPGGHVYAGCVATAAAQLMRYWNFPTQGRGSHTYYPEDHPEYGPLTVNFGATTYDWANMPATISSSSPMEEIDAVATLIYHAGVSVDMNYRPSSSGAVTSRLCTVMPQYFYYTDRMENIYRDDHTHDSYMALVTEAIDMSWPMVHRGNGHAYVLDGYNAAGLVHFNWGWSGSNDGWFDIDGHNYAEGESVIYNCVPEGIYAATADAPTGLDVTPAEDYSLSATVSWVNPGVSLTGLSLTAIDQIVVMRDNEVVYTEDNVTPGAAMSFVDNTVPRYDIYTYGVYAVIDGQRGRTQKVAASVGPTCSWKFVASSNNFQGWQGSYISVRNGSGNEAARVSVSNSSPSIVEVDIPLGKTSLVWVPSDNAQATTNITINVKDHDNNSVYSYSGTLGNMTAGLFFEGNNSCGNPVPEPIPGEVVANTDNGVVILSWPTAGREIIGYNVYRDGVLCQLVGSNEFVDATATLGGHCYWVCVLGDGGESESSNEVCATTGENCDPGNNLWYELQANFKPIINWEAPETEGLSGYAVYRKEGADGTYERIKLIGANKTEYPETKPMQDGVWYYYRVIAIYNGIDCSSAPFKAKFGNEYFVKVYFSTDALEETSGAALRIYPNPVGGQLTIEGEEMTDVAVYDLLGQQLIERHGLGETSQLVLSVDDLSAGLYLIKVNGKQGVSTHYFVKK